MIDMPMSMGHDLPDIYFREIDFADFLDWPIGSEHYVICKVCLEGKEVNRPPAGTPEKPYMIGHLKIRSVRALGTEPINVKTLDEQAWSKAKGEALAKHNQQYGG